MNDETVDGLLTAVSEVLEAELSDLAADRSGRNRERLQRVLGTLGDLGFLTASADASTGLGLAADVLLAKHLARVWGSLAWAALPALLSNRLTNSEEYIPTALAFPAPRTWSRAQREAGRVAGELDFVLTPPGAKRVLAVPALGAAFLSGIAGHRAMDLRLEGMSEASHDTVLLGGDGVIVDGDLLSGLRLLKAAVSCGLAAGAIGLGVQYARDRVQFGHPIGVYGEIRAIAARASTQCRAVEALVDQTARAWDAGACFPADAARALLAGMENATVVAERMQHVHGGYGQMAEFEIGRYMRDVRVVGAFDVPLPVLENVIGDELGMPRYPS